MTRTGLVHASVVLLMLGCNARSGPDAVEPAEPLAQRQGAVTLDGAAVIGFEAPAGWTASAGTLSSATSHTQGTAALALTRPVNYTTLTSAPLSSTLAGLAGIADPGSTMAVDLLMPTQQPNKFYAGALQLYVSCPSRGVYNQYLGQSELTGARLGVYRTLKFALTDFVRGKLAGATFADLTFTLALNAPAGTTGTYLFDNLRTRSPASPPAGPRQSADLVAQLSYAPALSTPGEWHFPAGVVQIPQSFHVKLGSAGTGTARLEIGSGAAVAITCNYAAATAGTSYALSSCTGGFLAGDLVPGDFTRLTIIAGNPAAGVTKIRAQLALNPLGDELGTGSLPPIPTFWGDTPAEINGIINAYSQALNAAPKTQERFVDLPIPEFAKRHGDGSPRNLLDPNLPPPPNDPPFSFGGHMNPGGAWDAYWQLDGSLSANDNGGNRHTSHFDAGLSGHAVVFGADVNVVSVNVAVDTDNGQVTPDGFTNPSTQGSLHMFLFDTELPGGGTGNATTGFVFNVNETHAFDAPTIHVWIFSITAGVNATAQMTTIGDLRTDGFHINATPSLLVGVHLAGGIDLGIASGAIDVSIQLINVSTPFDASATWQVSTNPTACGASLVFSTSGALVISTLGGNVDLVAKFGVCPFCDHERWNLFSWSGVDLGSQPLFNFTQAAQLFPVPEALCRRDLSSAIITPAAGGQVFNIESTALQGQVMVPSGATSGQTINTMTPLDCDLQTWTSSDPSDVGFPAHGCNPVVTFGTAGPRHVSLSGTDAFGETGSAAVDFTVVDLPGTGPVVTILSPAPGTQVTGPTILTLTGQAVRTTGTVTLTWSIGDVVIGVGPSVDWQTGGASSTVVITLTATDDQTSVSTTVTVQVARLPV